jgi:tetratricopeptide (TPR) repeat protein
MGSPSEITRLGEQGKRDFEAGRYATAADGFRRAAQGYAEISDRVNAAEQKNNLSVTLLKMRRAQEALDEAFGTDEVFAVAGDMKRQGMALNNQAAALQDLKRDDEALAAFERSAQLLEQAGERELRAVVLKAAAAIQLRRGRISESGLKMLGALGSTDRPTLVERVLKWLLRIWR